MPQRAMRGGWTAQVAAETPEQAHTWKQREPQGATQGRWTVQVAAETPEQAHTWKRRMPQRAMRGRWTAQVAAETPEQAHTWKRRMPQRAMRGRWTVQVAANSPKTAHTRKRRTSVMSPGRSCDGGPRRAVQNQGSWCTECHRKTAPHRIRPPAVRDTFAERFGATEVP